MAIIILAGGQSTRMQEQDKRELLVQGRPLLEYVVSRMQGVQRNVVLVTRERCDLRPDGLIWTRDIYRAGPLGGIHAGMLASPSQYNFIMACDMPFVDRVIVQQMLDRAAGDVLVPVFEGNIEPLHAVYHKRCLLVIENNIRAGNYRIRDVYAQVETHYLPFDELGGTDPRTFFNINTPGDYRRALDILDGEGE